MRGEVVNHASYSGSNAGNNGRLGYRIGLLPSSAEKWTRLHFVILEDEVHMIGSELF